MSALTVVETDLAYDARAQRYSVHIRQSPRIGCASSIDRTRIAHDRRRHRARIQRDHDIHTHISHTAPRRTSRRAPRTARELNSREPRKDTREFALLSTPRACVRRRRRPRTRRARARERDAHCITTYLDLRRLEGGDAGDKGGREERRHYCWFVLCVCENDARDRRRHLDAISIVRRREGGPTKNRTRGVDEGGTGTHRPFATPVGPREAKKKAILKKLRY